MERKIVNRRNFLKSAGSFLAGAVLFRLKNLFDDPRQSRKNKLTPREAKYYTSAGHLAG